MTLEKYLANQAALGIDGVKKLNELHVGVCGNGPIAQATTYNLIGLGVGSISNYVESDNFSDGIIRDLSYGLRREEICIDSIGDAIEFFAPELKYNVSRNVNVLSKTNCVVDTGETFVKHKNAINCSQILNSNPQYRATESLLCGALLANEVRKRAVNLSKYEQQLSDSDSIYVDLSKVLHPDSKNLVPKKIKRALVIGAGGLGTYCSYILATRGVEEIIICDHDTISQTNLNRQLFYTGRIGEPKVKVLSERISKVGVNVIGLFEKFSENFDVHVSGLMCKDAKNCIDAIFCCTDNYNSRLIASNYALEHKIPLVEGACSPTLGLISTYIPDKNKTIAQQRDLVNLVERENEKKLLAQKEVVTSCAQVANPSVIGPNVIVGASQAIALDDKINSCGDVIEKYPQVSLNLLLNKNFSHGVI